MSEQLQHPLLGSIRGKVSSEVVQYFELKYATLSDSLAPPELCTKYEADVYNATRHGPSCIQPPGMCDMEQGLIQHTLPHDDFAISDTEGLNLNLSMPLGSHKNLPVFVFIHGGGFRLGSNAWPQYDLARIVKLSTQREMPVIGINIKSYRLGALGFLTSNELREAGYKANNGIRDQRTALLWIKRNISGFGGDPENVTVVGESAGGVSCTLHLHSEEPLFKRLVSMSGTSLLMKPLPPFVADFGYTTVLKALNLDHLTAAERVKALLSTPVEELLKLPPTAPMLPMIDDDLIPSMVSFDQISTKGSDPALPGKRWCESLMIGDCKFDGNIFSLMLGPAQAGISARFVKSLSHTLQDHPSEAARISQVYEISPDTADDVGLIRILRFATDIGFYAPAMAFAEGWPEGKSAYLYHFNAPNPWDGPWKGKANHILDVAFLFQNYNEYLSAEQTAIAESFAEHFLSFINGKPPFPDFSAEKGGAMVYGPPASGAAFMESSAPEQVGRSGTISDIAQRTGFDLLATVWNNFMMGQ